MKIALCQINPTVGSFDYNRDLILKNYVESINRNADIVVFPELVITGYPPQDLLWEDGFIHQNLHILDTIAAQSTIPIILGFVKKENGNLYNSAAVCYDGKIQSITDKILLPTYDVFDEDRYFTKGREPKVVSVNISGKRVNIGIQICEDLWDHNYDCKVSEVQKKLGADILINISASPYHEGRLNNKIGRASW